MENEENIKAGYLIMMIVALTFSAFAYVLEDKIKRTFRLKKQ